MRVIIIDDDADDRQFLIDALRLIDHSLHVLQAQNWVQGLKHLDNNINEPIDYIFLDINMPVTNGKECLKIIKSNSLFRDIPVIMVSTSSYQKDQRDCLNAGALMYIVKPYRLDDLVEALTFLRREPHSVAANIGRSNVYPDRGHDQRNGPSI